MADFHVGTSGYQYDHRKGYLHPEDVAKRHWFEHYTRHFATVEINNTFYNLPSPETLDHWREQTPPGFRYALKYSRYGTHMKRLKDPESHIALFVERARRLRAALGPVLVQLPPKWKPNPERLDAFLAATPEDLNWVVELRDPSWLRDDVFDILRARGAVLCVHDLIDEHPRAVTAEQIYLRFHGPDGNTAGSYTAQTLSAIARDIREDLAAGREVWAYFNNDAGDAIGNAKDLRCHVERAQAG